MSVDDAEEMGKDWETGNILKKTTAFYPNCLDTQGFKKVYHSTKRDGK